MSAITGKNKSKMTAYPASPPRKAPGLYLSFFPFAQTAASPLHSYNFTRKASRKATPSTLPPSPVFVSHMTALAIWTGAARNIPLRLLPRCLKGYRITQTGHFSCQVSRLAFPSPTILPPGRPLLILHRIHASVGNSLLYQSRSPFPRNHPFLVQLHPRRRGPLVVLISCRPAHTPSPRSPIPPARRKRPLRARLSNITGHFDQVRPMIAYAYMVPGTACLFFCAIFFWRVPRSVVVPNGYEFHSRHPLIGLEGNKHAIVIVCFFLVGWAHKRTIKWRLHTQPEMGRWQEKKAKKKKGGNCVNYLHEKTCRQDMRSA